MIANVPNPTSPFATSGASIAARTPAAMLNINATATTNFVFQLLLLIL